MFTVNFLLSQQLNFIVLVTGTPLVYNISGPQDGFAVTGGDTLFINGDYFSSSSTVFIGNNIGNNECKHVTFYSSSLITCNTPPGTGSKLAVVVVDNQLSSLSNQLFSYRPPVISYIYPSENSWSAYSTISIFGNSFGVIDTFTNVILLQLNNLPNVYLSNTRVNNSLIRFTLDSSFDLSNVFGLVVSIGGQKSSVLYSPIVYTLNATSFDNAGGDLVTLNGNNFLSGSSILINNIPCQAVTFISSTTMQCLSNPGIGVGLNVMVISPNGLISPVNSLFNYMIPCNCP